MINLQNVQSLFCEYSGESLDNIDSFANYISVANAIITSRILPDITLADEAVFRLEMAVAGVAFYLYSVGNENTIRGFKVGDISVSENTANRALMVRDNCLALCADLLTDCGNFLFEQVKQ